MLLVAALALAAQVPTLTLPPGLGKKPAAMVPMSTVTVVVTGVRVPPPQKAPSQKELEAGLKIYKQRCVLCHGDEGAADGVGARRIQPEPQHLNDVIWQSSVTDAEIGKAILEGGAAVSRSPMMPANPDLKTKPKELASLIAYVRTLRAKYGSSLGSMALEDKSSRAVIEPADKTGTAKLKFTEVPKGKHSITVMIDGDGTVACTLEVVVDNKDQTLNCAAPPPAKK